MRSRWIPLILLLVVPALAQQSTSYDLNEHTLNAGGNPAGGVVLASTSYKITLDAIGEGVVQTGLASASFRMDGGFGSAYPPPGEVLDLRFTDLQTLMWAPEPSVGSYNLYRGLVTGLNGTSYGACDEQDITANSTTDSDPVPSGSGHFYLVTVENRLNEEGTLGRRSTGEKRLPASVCP